MKNNMAQFEVVNIVQWFCASEHECSLVSMKPLATDVNCCKPVGNEPKLRREDQDKRWIFHGSLADLPEGLKVLGENLFDEDSDCSEEELEEQSRVGASF